MNTLAIAQTPTQFQQLRRFSNLLYRRPNLYLSMLLVPPLIWFGAIYLGSLLTLLWQGFYTFDDFTMAVTPDLTLANFAALFQPVELRHHFAHPGHGDSGVHRQRHRRVPDCLLRGALHQRGKTKAFFYHRGDAADVGQLYRQGLCLDAAAGQGWRGAVVRPAPGPGAGVAVRAGNPGRGWQHLVHLTPGAFSGIRLHLAAVHDPADPGVPGASAAIAAAKPRQTWAPGHTRRSCR